MFIFEGIPPILCGIYSWFMLPNYPETSCFLTTPERIALLNNLPKTQPSSTSKTWDTGQFKAVFKDPITAAFILTWVFHAIGGWGISHVLPTVIYDLGFSASAISQLLTMPTYAFGCAALVFSGWLIHTKRIRSWVAAIALEILAMVCYVLLIVIKDTIAKYVLVTIATACSICIYPILWPERIRAAHGTTTAGLTIGMTNAAAQLNGIVGPQVYQSKFGPGYKIPYAVSIALLGGAVASIGATWWLVAKQNRTVEEENEKCSS